MPMPFGHVPSSPSLRFGFGHCVQALRDSPRDEMSQGTDLPGVCILWLEVTIPSHGRSEHFKSLCQRGVSGFNWSPQRLPLRSMGMVSFFPIGSMDHRKPSASLTALAQAPVEWGLLRNGLGQPDQSVSVHSLIMYLE
uniref:Uncharacterized protein n=1 Tax=Eutreptiella gymnastica TaxID=73025 RepID=A0A7S1JHI1_9EUGL